MEEQALKKYNLILPILNKEKSVKEQSEDTGISRPTLYRYLKDFKEHRLVGLARKERSDKGVSRSLNDKQIDTLVKAKKENYKRSAESLCWVLKEVNHETTVHESTIRRALKARGIDGNWRRKQPKVLLPMDITKPMEVWMGDYSSGPYLPHPLYEGKMAQTHLCLWQDAGGHMIMKAQYFFNANMFNGLLTLRDAMLLYGVPQKLCFDNGELKGDQMKRIAAYFGIICIPGRPYHSEGRAHVERQFRSIQDAFESELKISPVYDIDMLNQTFEAWQETFWYGYTKRGRETRESFMENKPSTRQVKPEELSLFLFEKKVSVRKNSIVRLEGIDFWVDPPLSGQKVIARYNPYDLSQIEIWVHSKRYQIAYPFDPNSLAYKLCRSMSQRNIEEEEVETVCDVLGSIRKQYRTTSLDSGVHLFIQLFEQSLSRPLEAMQKALAEQFWKTHGPFNIQEVRNEVEKFISRKGNSLHIFYYLEALEQLQKDRPT